MAWRSSGTTNAEMVDNLKRFSVITSSQVEDGFRNVDRKFFVPKGNESSAHSDEPLKEGNVHISAPHIYGSALEALELQPNSSLSFLNIGSGTGYLSCIVAEILGPRSQNFGVDIHHEVIEHCHESIAKWQKARKRRVCGKRQSGSSTPTTDDCPTIEIIHGNGLNISSNAGESLIGFDRIYIGAAVDRGDLPNIKKLLSPGGILVGPVDGELVKIVRIGPIRGLARSEADNEETSVPDGPNEFTQQVLSCVLFASLVKFPATETIIPAHSWDPSTHRTFPNSFQKASMTLLLCSHAKYVQPPPRPKRPECRLNVAATLPSDIWVHILTFTHRKWFEPQQTEVDFLKKRLLEEQANAAKAQKARLDAEALCHVAERERDVYRLLARRWQSRLQLIIHQQHDVRNASNALPASNIDEERTTLLGLRSAMLRHIHNEDDGNSQDGQHQLAAENDEIFLPGNDTTMQDVGAVGNTEMSDGFSKSESELDEEENDSDDEDEEQYEFHSLHSESGLDHEINDSIDGFQEDGTENRSMSMSESFELNTSSQQLASSKQMVVNDHQQARTISFSSEDL